MSVIGPSCVPPSENSPGCGCVAERKSAGAAGSKAAGAAVATALAAAACTACCVLPFTLPASLLALAGGSIAVLDHAHGWATRLAIAVVGCAWLWIGWRVWRTKQRISTATTVIAALATLLTASAASWPLIEPVAFHALGIVKKKPVQYRE
jgi:cytochrome bd-type quinol oxidase subunit 2